MRTVRQDVMEAARILAAGRRDAPGCVDFFVQYYGGTQSCRSLQDIARERGVSRQSIHSTMKRMLSHRDRVAQMPRAISPRDLDQWIRIDRGGDLPEQAKKILDGILLTCAAKFYRDVFPEDYAIHGRQRIMSASVPDMDNPMSPEQFDALIESGQILSRKTVVEAARRVLIDGIPMVHAAEDAGIRLRALAPAVERFVSIHNKANRVFLEEQRAGVQPLQSD